MGDTFGEGCGIWPVLLKQGFFNDACDWHDAAYTIKSWQEGHMTRAEVDAWFHGQMLRKASGNPLRLIQAHMFFGIARALGFFWWEGK